MIQTSKGLYIYSRVIVFDAYIIILKIGEKYNRRMLI